MSNEMPKLCVEADVYKNLPNITKVIHSYEMEFYFWVHLPTDTSRHFDIYQLDKLVGNDYIEIKTDGYIYRDDHHPWIRIMSGILERSEVGQHIYRLSMVNKATHDTCMMYFSYILQSEGVDKPYKYMDDNCHCEICECEV